MSSFSCTTIQQTRFSRTTLQSMRFSHTMLRSVHLLSCIQTSAAKRFSSRVHASGVGPWFFAASDPQQFMHFDWICIPCNLLVIRTASAHFRFLFTECSFQPLARSSSRIVFVDPIDWMLEIVQDNAGRPKPCNDCGSIEKLTRWFLFSGHQ